MPRSDDIPDWLRDAIERCMHDLQQPTVVELRVELSEDGEDVLFWESDGSGTGWFLLDEPRGAELVVRLADYLQEQVFPETREAWGEARPACPGHPHPASAVLLDGEAWWICPATEARLSVIGDYRP
jgi:hypothetical protein